MTQKAKTLPNPSPLTCSSVHPEKSSESQHFLEEEKCLRKGLKGTASRDFLLQVSENQRPHGEKH